MSDKAGAIVVGVDGSDGALNAARWAAAVAVRFGVSLHILHAKPSMGRNLTDTAAAIRAAVMSYQRDCAEIYLREAVDAVRSQYPDAEVTTESTNMPADEALIQLGRDARMIVVGSSQVTAAGALFVGSTTLAVATHANCPVVAWRGPHTVPTNQPIVVGADGTDSSAVALETAFEVADRFAVKLVAVRSWSIGWPASAVTNPFLADWDALEAVQWTELTDVVDRCNQRHPEVYASCFIESARPTAALLHQIDVDGAQLVVVGNRGRKALASAVLGSTTLSLLHHSTVPVMVCAAAGTARLPV
jgi:nucleotide-binding universal stress UspA family protein